MPSASPIASDAAVSRCRLSKISCGHARVDRERGAWTLDCELAGFEHIAIVGTLQRRPRVLFDQQDRNATGLERRNDAEYFLDDQRRQTEARFIEHQQSRLGH